MASQVSPSELLSVEEAARYLGVAPQTLHNWRCTGRYRLPCIRVGRLAKYRRADLDAWIENRRQTHTGESQEG